MSGLRVEWRAAWLGLAVGIPGVLNAAQWDVTPRIQGREVYTDNVRLAPSGRQSDFITEVEPGIAIRGRGSRLNLEADYSFQHRWYVRNSDANGHNHQLNSRALLDAWERNLFVEASATIAQQNISPLGAQGTSNVNITNNRTEVRQATLSPYWVSRLGPWANIEARYTAMRADYTGEASALDSNSEAVRLVISNGPSFGNLGWSVDYSDEQIDSKGGEFDRRDLESVSANAQYRLLPTLSLLGTIGYEDNSYGTSRGSLSGSFWNAGLQWVPSQRTKVRATFGQRYFGNTYFLDAEHRTRLTTWTVGYSEQLVATPTSLSLPGSVSTAQIVDRLLVSQIADPALRSQAVQAFITQFGLPRTFNTALDFVSNQVSLSKKLNAGFGFRGARSTFLLNAYHEKRTNENEGSTTSILGTDPFLISDSMEQSGYSGVFSWRFSSRTSGFIEHSLSRNRFDDNDRKDTITTVRVGFTHQLGPRLYGGVNYQFTERESTDALSDYRENSIIGTITLTF